MQQLPCNPASPFCCSPCCVQPSHPSHAYIRGMAEKKGSALSATQHYKYTKCFMVLPTGKNKCQCINEQKWFGYSDCAVCRKCLVLLFCLERVRTDRVGSMLYKVYTCCCLKKHSCSEFKSRYNFKKSIQSL